MNNLSVTRFTIDNSGLLTTVLTAGSFSLSASITAKELTYDKCTGQSRGIKCGEGNSIEIMEASFGKIDGADCGNKASDICDTVR